VRKCIGYFLRVANTRDYYKKLYQGLFRIVNPQNTFLPHGGRYFDFMKIIRDDEYQKVIQNPDGSVRVIQKQKEIIKKGSPGYFKIFKKRWFDEWEGLTPAQRSIMVSLWLYGAGTGQSWASMRKLAGQLKLNTDTILENIKKLEKLKFLKTKKGKGRGRYFNIYILLK